MTLNRMGEPFKGKVWYWVEAAYGGGPSGTTLPVSCKVQDVRPDTGDRHRVLRGIEEPTACYLQTMTKEPTLHLEYIPQDDDTLMTDVINRGSCCTLQSLCFEVGMNTCLGDADNITYYLLKGCKPETVRISASKNADYMVTIDFQAKSLATSTTATGVEPTALSGEYYAFNIAGEITKTGGHVVNTDHIAFVLNSIDITFSHKLDGHTDHDAVEKSYLLEGDYDIEGSVDISLDGGGGYHINEVLLQTAFTIQIDMGTTTFHRITLPNCQWKSGSVNKDISGEGMFDSAPFTCKPSNCTNIITKVTP